MLSLQKGFLLKVVILGIGKTNEKYLEEGISMYEKRLKHYTNFELKLLPDIKKYANAPDLMEKEGVSFLQFIEKDDFLILCDERGKRMTSVGLADFLEKQQISGARRLVFLIGGAFGIGNNVRERVDLIVSLSDLTFSHQMIRLFLAEQIYRAFTIKKKKKYHNE